VSRFAQPRRLRAFIGPHVSATRYQVGADVAERFDGHPRALLPDGDQRWRLDLGRVAHEQLLSAGLEEGNVVATPLSTDDSTMFFSDRRTRPCGRFALAARRQTYDAAVKKEAS
jgi:polyphenol oxidase